MEEHLAKFDATLPFTDPGLLSTPTYITLPISIPGAKLNDSQTVQIQVLNPNALNQNNYQQKLHYGHIHINSNQSNTTVLTVAYNNEENEILQHNGYSEDMTVLAAIQPQDLQTASEFQLQGCTVENDVSVLKTASSSSYSSTNKRRVPQLDKLVKKQSLDTSREKDKTQKIFNNEEERLLKKMKPKNRSISKINHKPGQVHIATALDGTILFCCPECQMAYSEKSYLEKHLSLHKIERRFICDICGAGLKRKEHLERHKMGHNPDRPYTCTACGKGFKRKEHLNLHIVIHSGNKTEVCGECGKGFYRKDHLRKHIKSHVSKRMKETSESFEKLTKPNYAEHKNTVYETYAHFTMGEEMEKLNKL